MAFALRATFLPLAALLVLPALAATPAATQWWADVSALASDDNEGRMTGSPGYDRAAGYVIERFKALGLKPAGSRGFLQTVVFEQQTVDQTDSSLALISATGVSHDLQLGEDAVIAPGGGPRPDTIEAPMVFIGYGLHLPDQGHDDFAGMDLKGKIVVVLSGGPSDISGPLKSNARFARIEQLGRLGAVGVITLTTAHQIEIPWARQKLISHQPGLYLADKALRDTPNGFLTVTVDPEKSDALFAGSGQNFAELSALADASKPLPHFELPLHLKARVVAKRQQLTSPNLVASLPGSDPKLATEYVGVSAHLDHLGVGEPIGGDRIYNGAMDDASGVATVLDIAQRLKAGPRPRRSILFLIFTAEEKGLLGSHYFALRPTIPKGAQVADLNFDMPLPLWPLKTVYAPGDGESTLGADIRAVAAQQGLAIIPDPLPDRNVFTRTDQFSFVREGVPALAFKFGFAKGTPEFDIEHAWRANRYHAPSDDLQQPVEKEEAVKLDAFMAGVALRLANADTRPQFLPTSIFARKDN
jgi:Zn-dependent M28 family amino/carboxypeptidase